MFLGQLLPDAAHDALSGLCGRCGGVVGHPLPVVGLQSDLQRLWSVLRRALHSADRLGKRLVHLRGFVAGHAGAVRERGDEGVALEQTVRAISLNRSPLPQLSLGAWQMNERGHEVDAVRAWHEAKSYALEVSRAVQELDVPIQDWLDRQAERVLDRVAPEHDRREPDTGSRRGILRLSFGRLSGSPEPSRKRALGNQCVQKLDREIVGDM